MAKILNDVELTRLLGTVIVDGHESSIRPNSYILRLGAQGEFLNTGKEFELGAGKKGIRIQPGHSVGVTAHETLDFTRDTVQEIFPGEDLHGILSPTTDLSREGIGASTTQVDAGYFGTLNWTLTNSSAQERRFVHKERLYRLTILRLQEGETPDKVYAGDYQDQKGYLRSARTGAPVGMKDAEWEDASVSGGPEEMLDNLIKSGYPWQLLGTRLKEIDQQFKTVTQEYADIDDAIRKQSAEIKGIHKTQGSTPDTVRQILRDEAGALQNRWLIGVGSILISIAGLSIALLSSKVVLAAFREYGPLIGFGLVVIGTAALIVISRRK